MVSRLLLALASVLDEAFLIFYSVHFYARATYSTYTIVAPGNCQ